MELQAITDRVKGILLNPHQEWIAIKAEQQSNKDIILYYVLPFTALAAFITLLVFISSTYLSIGLAFRAAALQLFMPIIAVVVAAVVVNELAETFDSVKNLNNAFKLVAYSYTPALLISLITSLSWALSWLGILGLYGAYLFWVGLPVMMETPEKKRLVYIIATIAVIILVNLIIGAVFGIQRLGYY